MTDPNDNMAVVIAAGLRDAAAQFEALAQLALDKIAAEKELAGKLKAANELAGRIAACLQKHARFQAPGLPYAACSCCRRIRWHAPDCEIGAVLAEVRP